MRKSSSFLLAILAIFLMTSCNQTQCLTCSSCLGCEDIRSVCRDKYEREPHALNWDEYVIQETTNQPGSPAFCKKAD